MPWTYRFLFFLSFKNGVSACHMLDPCSHECLARIVWRFDSCLVKLFRIEKQLHSVVHSKMLKKHGWLAYVASFLFFLELILHFWTSHYLGLLSFLSPDCFEEFLYIVLIQCFLVYMNGCLMGSPHNFIRWLLLLFCFINRPVRSKCTLLYQELWRASALDSGPLWDISQL